MSLTAGILLFLSACVHAGWNLVGKRQHPTAAHFFLANATGAILLTPVILWYHEVLWALTAQQYLLALTSGVGIAFYNIFLAATYRRGDMSVAYPLVRSSPVLVVMTVTFLLGQGDQVSWICIGGILLVVAGAFCLPMQTFRDLRLRNYLNACCACALLAAIGTTLYSVADAESVLRLQAMPTVPLTKTDAALVHAALEWLGGSLWLGLYVALRASERQALMPALQNAKRSCLLVGCGSLGGYILVLVAYALVQNVSYAVAFRQVSIPIGALLGIAILKEPCPGPKRLAIFLIFAGLVLVGLG